MTDPIAQPPVEPAPHTRRAFYRHYLRASGLSGALIAASLALLRRAGMRQEAHFMESYWSKGEWADDVVFGILEREWEEIHFPS